jgi:DeoR/GlpR family transcriptional regulator of sugar metabolism
MMAILTKVWVGKMLYIERLFMIKQMLLKQESVSVNELSKYLKVAGETIRRDLDKIANEDANVVRVHGGAYYAKPGLDTPYSIRESAIIAEKEQIAQNCFRFIRNNDCLMMDCSTTTLSLANLLAKTDLNLTVITNAPHVVDALAKSENIRIICIGGCYDAVSRSFLGPNAIEQLAGYHADQAFVSCSGLHMEFGVSDSSEEEAALRRLMLKNSKSRNLLIDSSKFGRCKTNKIVELEQVDAIFTDKEPNGEWLKLITKNNVRLFVSGIGQDQVIPTRK